MRKNEHPSCGCDQCRRGIRTDHGHFVVKYVNRKLRRLYREALRTKPDEVVQIIVSTPYTD
jgi:hypothetical protein